MYPSHASLPLPQLERLSRCPWCGRCDPRCGSQLQVSPRLEVVTCAFVSNFAPIMVSRSFAEVMRR
jgi:hypothetical protein